MHLRAGSMCGTNLTEPEGRPVPFSLMHTHANEHARTHATHTHTRTPSRMHAHTRTRTRTQTHACISAALTRKAAHRL